MSLAKNKIYFRADGSSQIGLGHVIRSLALAEMLCDVFDCIFIIKNPNATLKKNILEICKEIIVLDDSIDLIEEANFLVKEHLDQDVIMVIDGYHFETTYQKIIKANQTKLVAIDDIHAYHFLSDIVFNLSLIHI